jgi:hypothetical protein
MPRLIARPSRALLVLAATVVAACGAGAQPASPPASPVTPSAGGVESASAVVRTPSPAPTPVPTPVNVLPQPPAALLAAEHRPGEPRAGALGSYTWGDNGSDAPWIVPSGGSEVRAGDPLSVSFDPAAAPVTWTARWAPVAGDGPGDVAASAEGSGPPVFGTPDRPGTWSLQLEAGFGNGRSAVWYWRIEVP